ncbi:ubiquitin carboxyl-terminal esterase L3 [Gonapodya prolifera JEL478]|uniref:Ubiquitin carboxyl-terminal hydrolase n=1 Tax=Gonapodya prolifera (strain JEL478) TaxID=1344416 RepID=A0A139A445_GONPJ|nr:ubiquitin carboxyl-terminal esterase L3 [Gonapodya prolifera JEL478]|eukprot:KXS11596.1 ubiquitin carboxyl-terminal esterase L3 [Gonapodya prolifera JEL478]
MSAPSTHVDNEPKERIRWLPLESNPDVMNNYASKIGVDMASHSFVDVWSLDHEVLAFVPQPVLAVILLFPTSDNYHNFTRSQIASIQAAGQTVDPLLYFARQTIANACGTFGMLHALTNNTPPLTLKPDGILARIVRESEGKTPDERAAILEVSNDLAGIHDGFAHQGQTQAPSLDEDITPHFISFISKSGHLYEMDGAKPFPINHGPCTQDELLAKSIEVVRGFIQRDPDMLQFTLIALAPN